MTTARALTPHRGVSTLQQLIAGGWTYSAIRSQISARRWQRLGRAVVMHNAEPSSADIQQIVLANSGPRAVLTSFTALESYGLTGWSRPTTHVLVPGGARLGRLDGLDVCIHWTGRWPTREVVATRRLHRPAQSALLAANGLTNPRSACAVVAASVQQRLITPEQLAIAVRDAARGRHHQLLRQASADIGQGAEALSEIDFAVLCRRAHLPEPVRQAVRVEPSGRRRYLDAEWRLRNGDRLVVEVDGALHLAASRWWDDQLRQNELVISGSRVLRFPSVVIRCEQQRIVDQLRRALA